jgi:hypothetical protein
MSKHPSPSFTRHQLINLEAKYQATKNSIPTRKLRAEATHGLSPLRVPLQRGSGGSPLESQRNALGVVGKIHYRTGEPAARFKDIG